jgi:DNA ligase (NAD+)
MAWKRGNIVRSGRKNEKNWRRCFPPKNQKKGREEAMNESSIKKMKELGEKLREASRAYYQEDREIMSNVEYDALYDTLSALEKETGIVLADSPTVNVGYEAVEQLPKEEHERPMLSLDKTKEREALREFIGEHPTLLSWKLDGLTIVLTYENGELIKAVTRGNGIVGEVITNNARVFKNIPLKISFKGRLVLRGEAIITYSDFEKINETIGDADAKYKNPRNLCSGSVRQLNNEITAKRNVRFYAFSLVSAEGVDFRNSREVQFRWLNEQGFEVVEYRKVTAETLDEAMDYFAEAVTTNDFPSDGLVALYDDIAYGESLGTTAKFPRNAMAFKWADEMRDTRLLEIEWSPSRTGLINPVAIFEPVELEGTTVSRASVHNISIMKELKLGIGDTIRVYKANMIIPQIAENLTGSGNAPIPHTCPACGQETVVKKENDVECLFCVNPGCPAKKIKSFGLFTSRDAMNIDGLSEATLEKFIARGFIHDFGDIFEISRYKDEIVEMEGFGQKSYDNLMESLERAKETTLPRVIYSLGIANIGLANAKVICRHFDNDLDRIRHASLEEVSDIDTIGPVIAGNLVAYFRDEDNDRRLDHLMSFLHIQEDSPKQEQIFEGMNFVITGSLVHFGNRSEAKELIESLGGKVTGSVTKKTNYLINNDIQSNSSKNKKARELGIPILSEEDFRKLAGVQ